MGAGHGAANPHGVIHRYITADPTLLGILRIVPTLRLHWTGQNMGKSTHYLHERSDLFNRGIDRNVERTGLGSVSHI